MKVTWREKWSAAWRDPVWSKVIATVITAASTGLLVLIGTYFWPQKTNTPEATPTATSPTPQTSQSHGERKDDRALPPKTQESTEPAPEARVQEQRSAPDVAPAPTVDRRKMVFIDCRMGTMPSAVPPPGRIFALLTSHLPAESGGGGLAEYFSTSAKGGEFAWTNDKSPAWAYRCDITNYAEEVLVDVMMNFRMTFRSPLEVPGQPNALKQGEVTLDRLWPVTIAKIDRGPESPFTFYVWNCCVDRFVTVRAPSEAVAQGNGPMMLEVRQSATNLHQELNPTSLWQKGVR